MSEYILYTDGSTIPHLCRLLKLSPAGDGSMHKRTPEYVNGGMNQR